MNAISQKEVEQRLGLGRVHSQELAHIISETLPLATYPTASRIDFFPEHKKDFALSLIFDKKGDLQRVAPTPHLTADTLSQIVENVERKLLDPPIPLVSDLLLFTHRPVCGYWRYKDKITIRPVPESAPRIEGLNGDHPLIVEVKFDGSHDWHLSNLRAQREPRQLTLLLSLLVPGIKIPTIDKRRHWVMRHTAEGVRQSLYMHEGYYSGQPSEISPVWPPPPMWGKPPAAFTPQGDLPEIEMTEALPPLSQARDRFVLPSSMEENLDIFFEMPQEQRERILRSAYWLHHAMYVSHASRSDSFQALIQAIESLVETPKNLPRCGECRKTKEGPTALFKAFINTYAPVLSSADEKARKVLYGKRSDLTHGKVLFIEDANVGLWHYTPQAIYEMQLAEQARAICHRAIMGWLSAQKRQEGAHT
ncbi:hypothetical protein [Streptomyces sp. NPDC000878]